MYNEIARLVRAQMPRNESKEKITSKGFFSKGKCHFSKEFLISLVKFVEIFSISRICQIWANSMQDIEQV